MLTFGVAQEKVCCAPESTLSNLARRVRYVPEAVACNATIVLGAIPNETDIDR
jgi:hypothetical protein